MPPGLRVLTNEEIQEIAPRRGEEQHAEEGATPSFDDLFRQYRHMVFTLACRMLGNTDDALELSQEVFLAVYKGLAAFRGECSLKTWLYRITVSRAMNHLRWRKSRRFWGWISLQGLDREHSVKLELKTSVRVETPEQRFLEAETGSLIFRALRKLPDHQRAILVLRDMEGLSYGEIAQTMGISEGTVKSRISRAREQAREWMDKLTRGGE